MRLSQLYFASLAVLFASMVVSAKDVTESDLLKAKGMPVDAVVQIIGKAGISPDLDLSLAGKAKLLSEGIPEKVIDAVEKRQEELEAKKSGNIKKLEIADSPNPAPVAVVGSTPAETITASGACPAESGVSVRTRTGWKEVEPATPQPEIARGAFKGVLTGGLTKVSNKWELPGSTAPLKVGPDAEFCVRDGQASLRNITLAVLESHKGKREVTYSTQRMFTGQTGGRDDKHFRPVNASRTPDGAFLVKLSGLEPGEYALDLIGMPQYDFSVSEGAALASN